MTSDNRYDSRYQRAAGPIDLNRNAVTPPYAGFITFMRQPVCLTPEDLRVGGIEVAVCGVPWDGTQSTRSGSHAGPQGIRACDYYPNPQMGALHQHVRVDPVKELKIADYGDADVIIGDTERTFKNVRSFIREIAETGAIPLILGGDHGITWPNVSGLADVYGFGSIGVVHFDAHADTAPDMQGSLASHGTPMRRLIESGAVLGKNFVQVGLRGYWPDAPVLAWMEEQGMRSHFMAEIEHRGFAAVLETAVSEALDGADHLFISVDVDVADPAFAPGTGSPEPGGLTSRELLWAVRRLAAEVGIVGMDVVEVAPIMDSGNNITCLLAHRCVMEAMTGIAMRKLGMTSRDYVDPRAAGGPGASAPM